MSIEELIQEIALKAYEVNKGTEHTVFLNFSGHVQWLELSIYTDGWKKDQAPNIDIRACLTEKYAKKICKRCLKS